MFFIVGTTQLCVTVRVSVIVQVPCISMASNTLFRYACDTQVVFYIYFCKTVFRYTMRGNCRRCYPVGYTK
jgi:hypothetical protein